MKTKFAILMLSLLLSCTTDKQKQLEQNIQARQDTIEQVQNQVDSLKVSEADYKEFEQQCHH